VRPRPVQLEEGTRRILDHAEPERLELLALPAVDVLLDLVAGPGRLVVEHLGDPGGQRDRALGRSAPVGVGAVAVQVLGAGTELDLGQQVRAGDVDLLAVGRERTAPGRELEVGLQRLTYGVGEGQLGVGSARGRGERGRDEPEECERKPGARECHGSSEGAGRGAPRSR
jgi:hypothetical protein